MLWASFFAFISRAANTKVSRFFKLTQFRLKTEKGDVIVCGQVAYVGTGRDLSLQRIHLKIKQTMMKKNFLNIVLIAVIVVGKGLAQPVEQIVKIVVAPDHSDWVYRTGEHVKFSIVWLDGVTQGDHFTCHMKA